MSPIRQVLMAALLVALSASPALAAEQTVVLDVDNMTCASCPYIVEKSLQRVAGVTAAEASFEDRTVTVTFDDATTDLAELTQATGDAGYPSRPRN